MNKVLVFDMDGTIADLYGVKNWLNDLRAENVRPYVSAKPLYNMEELNNLLLALKNKGWKIIVTTWLSMGSTVDYENRTRVAKKGWLDKYKFPYDELHMVRYGTTKANCTRKLKGYQILIDDNAKIRKGWTLGSTIDANKNILKNLADLLTK